MSSAREKRSNDTSAKRSAFGDNVSRLMGMHRLKANEAKDILDVSATAVSELTRSKREPQLQTLMRVAEFFEVPAHELLRSDFGDLLEVAGDRERYARVEKKIARARRPLRSVKR